jgi:hypothetical protein
MSLPEGRRPLQEAPRHQGGELADERQVAGGVHAHQQQDSAKDAGLLTIDRENECLNTVAAADAGVGARPDSTDLPG